MGKVESSTGSRKMEVTFFCAHLPFSVQCAFALKAFYKNYFLGLNWKIFTTNNHTDLKFCFYESQVLQVQYRFNGIGASSYEKDCSN